jgi:transglutaminase-like putative cysteine protease
MARFRLREGWITFVLLGAAILTVTGAIQRADWTDDLAILTPITFAGLILGLAFAKWRRLPAMLTHLLALVVGLVFIVNRMQAVPDLLPLAPDANSWLGAVRFLIARGQSWYGSAGTDAYADDFYLFVFGLAGLMWILSYTCTWMLFRSRWIWPALLLPATVLLVNLGYATSALSNYLVLFVICALLLVVRFHVVEREDDWRRNGVAFPQSLGWRALWIGVVVVILTVGFGWGAPFTVSGPTLAAAWGRVNGPWERLETSFGSRFGSLRGNSTRGIGNFASFGDRFRLGGPLKLSQAPVLVMQADQPYYLKARTYDNFDGQIWSSTVDDTFVHTNDGQQFAPQVSLPPNQSLPVPELQSTEERSLNIRMLENKGNTLFTADQLVSNSQDSYVVMSWTQYRNQVIDLNTTKAEDLPPDLRTIYGLLVNAQGDSLRNTDEQGNVLRVLAQSNTSATRTPGGGPRRTATVADNPTPTPTPVFVIPTPSAYERQIIQERGALTARLVDVRPIVQDGKAVRIIVNGQLPNYGDVESIQPRATVGRGATYQTTISTSTALAPALREAGTNYPAWVTQRYLQIPASTTERTRQLAKDLQNGQDQYDAALAIQGWLRDNITYNENIDYPPADQNLVDYVLFQNRQGYCEYYSTAMVMMLRSIGIPAREAVGFFSGEYDDSQGGYLYRESNAHAWPEAYFPGYGWIRFEPTSARAVPDREPAPEAAPASADGTVIDGGSGAGGPGGLLPDDPAERGLTDGGFYSAPPAEPSRFWAVTRIVVSVVVVLIALLCVLWLFGLRGLSSSSQFYARMTRSGRLAGVRPPLGATPYEWAREVGARVPDAQRSLDQITTLYVRERYAGKPPTVQELRLIQRAWLSLRGALVKSVLSLRRQHHSEGGD